MDFAGIFFIVGTAAFMFLLALIAYVLGYFFTEKHTLVDIKPFNCRPCLTFWLTVVFTCLLASCVVAPYSVEEQIFYDLGTALVSFNGVGFLIAFINFFYIKSSIKITL